MSNEPGNAVADPPAPGEPGRPSLDVEASKVSVWDTTDTPDGQATYVVQQLRLPAAGGGGVRNVWVDVARLHFPLKTQAKTVLLTVVVERLGHEPTEGDRYRVLNAENARERKLKPKQRSAPEYEVE